MKITHLLLVALLFICTACPYESSIPITAAGEKIDKTLLGTWKKNVDDADFFVITKKDNHTYTIEENNYNSEGETFDKKYYSAHLSEIDKTVFINILDPETKDGTAKYYLYKMGFDGNNTLVLTPLSEHIREQFVAPKDLEAFVRKYMQLSFFFGKEETYTRTKE